MKLKIKAIKHETPAAVDNIKRFYVPAIITWTCPECRQECERDCDENYFSYPPVGKPFHETLTCYHAKEDGTTCEHEVEVKLQIDVKITLSVKK